MHFCFLAGLFDSVSCRGNACWIIWREIILMSSGKRKFFMLCRFVCNFYCSIFLYASSNHRRKMGIKVVLVGRKDDKVRSLTVGNSCFIS